MSERRYRISEIKLNRGESEKDLSRKIRRKLKDPKLKIRDLTIVRRSLDARKKPDIRWVYTLDFTCGQKLKLPEAPDMSYHEVPSGDKPMEHRPVIVGFGPCGMFAGLILAERGYRPVILERGCPIEERVRKVDLFWKEGILDTECNVQFGEGGAGTFSDGKLTSGIRDPRKRKVLEEFVEAGADPAILYDQKPHIGTDVLRDVVRSIRRKIVSLGGDVIFGTRMEDLNTVDGRLVSIRTRRGEESQTIEADDLILAIGHSARDTMEVLKRAGLEMSQKPLSIGVRIEHPQSMVDLAQYGEQPEDADLPPAVYNLSHHCENGRGVYTFCMCPGGVVVVASSEEGHVVVNGMSYHDRDSGTANSALLVDVRTSDFGGDDVLAGIDFQRKYEREAYRGGGGNFQPPRTTWKAFRDGDPEAEGVRNSLPDFAVEAILEAMPALARKLKGFDDPDAILTAVETRSSSPVRISRDESGESSIRGLYPGGEGAGHAGGIMSSAVDGIRLAEQIIQKYRIE